MSKSYKISLRARTFGTHLMVALALRFSYGAVMATCDNVSHATCTAQVPLEGVDVIVGMREAQEVEAVDQLCLLVRHAYALVPLQWIAQVALLVKRLPLHMAAR